MKRVFLLILVALITFGIILYIRRPELIEDFYLWIVGFIGPILAIGEKILSKTGDFFSGLFSKIKILFKRKSAKNEPLPTATAKVATQSQALPPAYAMTPYTSSAMFRQDGPRQTTSVPLVPQIDTFKGITLRLIRFSDDGQTTIGHLFQEHEEGRKFLCYTLEDTFKAQNIMARARIPSGTYRVDYNVADTPMTLRYRTRYAPWFTYHLHIKEVPNHEGIYIHHGGVQMATKGCIVISDQLHKEDKDTFLINSRNAFKRIYQEMSAKLQLGKEMRLIIED